MNYIIYLEYMYRCDRFNYSSNSPSSHCAVSHVNQNLKAPIYEHNLLKISVSNSNIMYYYYYFNIIILIVCVCMLFLKDHQQLLGSSYTLVEPQPEFPTVLIHHSSVHTCRLSHLLLWQWSTGISICIHK